MEGLKSVHVQMCTCSQPTGAACKQTDWAAGCLPSSLCLLSVLTLFLLFNLTSPCQFNLLTLLILPWPFCSLMWLDVILFHFLLVSFFHSSLTARVSLSSKPIISTISHFTTQTRGHITDSYKMDVFVACTWSCQIEKRLNCEWLCLNTRNITCRDCTDVT